jgi:type I restriction enzyme S subunit
MKDSGVEWIGEIPKDWDKRCLKTLLTVLRGGSPRPIEEYLTDSPDGINWIKIGDTTKGVKEICSTKQKIKPSGLAKSRMVHKGDLLLTNSMSFGEPYFLEVDGCIHDGWVCLTKLHGIDKLFLYYFLRSDFCKTQFQLQVDGGVVQNLNIDKIGDTYIYLPSLSEQQSIAAYLDEKCAAIDEIIAEAKATIDEYKLWKASVIFEAVTKGLNPNAEMKDSGVEWIGRIPKDWSICKLKWLCEKITDGSHFSPETTDDGYPYITASDVNGKGLNYHLAKRISPSDFEELEKTGCRPQNGDVLLVKDGATTGRVGLMTDNEPCVALSSVAILRPAKTVNSCYLMYLIMSEILQYQIRKSMAGSAMPRTTLSKLVNYVTVSAPLSEQQAISAYLDEKCAAIDGVIAEKEALIGELESYKKSLIFETVTGKRRVC